MTYKGYVDLILLILKFDQGADKSQRNILAANENVKKKITLVLERMNGSTLPQAFGVNKNMLTFEFYSTFHWFQKGYTGS